MKKRMMKISWKKIQKKIEKKKNFLNLQVVFFYFPVRLDFLKFVHVQISDFPFFQNENLDDLHRKFV